jgi:hypothetical protein
MTEMGFLSATRSYRKQELSLVQVETSALQQKQRNYDCGLRCGINLGSNTIVFERTIIVASRKRGCTGGVPDEGGTGVFRG